MMTKFSIFIMILFLFCGYAANGGGGTFAFIEVLMATDLDDYDTSEKLVLLLTIAAQIGGVYALIRSNSKLMLGVVITLSLIVILVTIASADAIGKVIWVNSLFVLSAVVHVVVYFRNKSKVETVIHNELTG